MKLASVCTSVTTTSAMPPRMPIVVDGVFTMTSEVLLTLPPTKRITPLLTAKAISPFCCEGS